MLHLLFSLCSVHLTHALYESQVGSASWGYQQIAVFVTGADHVVWYLQYDGSLWSPWKQIASYASSGPAVCSWGWGRLDVFVQADDALYVRHIVYDYSLSGAAWWNAWESWGCCLYSGVAVATYGNGNLVLYGIGMDYQMWGQSISAIQGWYCIGRPSTNVFFTSDPPGAIWMLQRLYVFGRGSDNYLYYLSCENNIWDPQWTQTDMVMNSGLAVVTWDSMTIHIFYRDINNELIHNCILGQMCGNASENLHGNITSTPSVSAWGYGRFDVFAKWTDNCLWWISYDQCNGWSQWQKMGELVLL